MKATIINDFLRWDTIVGKIFISLIMIGVSLLISYEVHQYGEKFAAITIIFIVGTGIALFSLFHLEFGFYAVIFYAFFANFAKRLILGLNLSQANIPLGIGVNVLLAVVFVGLIIREIFNKNVNWSGFWTPITIFLFIDIVYTIILVSNPIGPGISSWLELGFRWISFDFMLIIVAYAVFSSLRNIITFTKFWLVLILASGIYTMYQEYIGLPIWDYKFLHSSAEVYKLNFIGGRFRLFGLLGDVSEAGLFMAYSSIVIIIFIYYVRNNRKRIQLGLMVVITLLAMAYSGTRSAYAILPLGLALFTLINIKQKVAMIATIFGFFLLIIILFAPIYNPTVKRIRSTFYPENDPSYQLREEKWSRIQPWIREHPVGSGIGTFGPLIAGKEEADSGYFSEAIERGWIGLLIKLGLGFVIVSYGIGCFYRSEKRIFKALYLAYICGFFAMTIAHMIQDALDKWPSYVIMEASFIIIIRLKQFENRKDTLYE